MKTTEVRKLLPEQFGFVCPVHTPDGSPCGLLNHISKSSRVVTQPSLDYVLSGTSVKKLLKKLGMVSLIDTLMDKHNAYVELQLDGRILGYVDTNEAKMFTDVLRKLKCKDITADQLKINKK